MGCKKVRNPKRIHCLADFRHFIKIIDAEIIPNQKSYELDNSDIILQVKAKVKTVSPFSTMNGVNVDTGVTHQFVIRFIAGIKIQKNFMILFNSELYRIETVVNENEDNLFIIIRCSKRGNVSLGANQA